MAVGLVGSGPAIDAVAAALSDVDAETVSIDVDALDGFDSLDLAVVAARAGQGTFERVSDRAREAGVAWIAVEIGGVGGVPVVDASVTGFAPETACYRCLAGRVAANADPDTEPTAAPEAHTARLAGAIAGHQAAMVCSTEATATVFGTVRELPHAERPLLALPNCACESAPGPGGSTELDRTHVDRDLEESLARAERGLDERVGVVQQVGEAESFPAPYYLARGCDTAGFSDVTAARDAAGVAPGWDAAFMKALGEAYERYCAGIYRLDALPEGSPDAVDDSVPPSAFVCADPPSGDDSIRWVRGRDLHAEEPVSLPAEFVYYPPPAERYRPAITTGLGLGNGGAGAILAGLTETIERDAAMLAWYSTFEPIALTVEDEAYRSLVARARSEDLSVTAILLTQDVDLPVIGVAVQREEWPRFAIGTSAGLEAEAAARSALAEALQNWMELRGMGPDDAADAMGAIGDYATDPGLAADFVDVDTVASASTVGPDGAPTGEEAVDEVLDRLAAADLSAYAARTTTRDVADLGFEAVRVLVPAAQPLCFGDPYFGERATAVPAELGFEPRPDREHHPFP